MREISFLQFYTKKLGTFNCRVEIGNLQTLTFY